MKKTFFLIFLIFINLGVNGQEVCYRPAIAAYIVTVDNDLRSAFENVPTINSTDEERKKYIYDELMVAKTGRVAFTAYLADTCFKVICDKFNTKNTIEAGPKIPDMGKLSYTPYNYPQIDLRKAAKTGLANNYIRMELDFSYKEFKRSSHADKTRMTPMVKVSFTLSDEKGKIIADAAETIIASSMVPGKIQMVQTAGGQAPITCFRADEAVRTTFLFKVFNQAVDEATAKLLIKINDLDKIKH